MCIWLLLCGLCIFSIRLHRAGNSTSRRKIKTKHPGLQTRSPSPSFQMSRSELHRLNYGHAGVSIRRNLSALGLMSSQSLDVERSRRRNAYPSTNTTSRIDKATGGDTVRLFQIVSLTGEFKHLVRLETFFSIMVCVIFRFLAARAN